MNTRPPMESPSPTVALSVNFNDDCRHFAVGLNSGFCIFDAETCSLVNTRDFNAGIGLVQMLGASNYLGLVGGGRQPKFAANKLILWNESKSRADLEISALTPVRGAQLSRERIILVLQNSVRVYKFAKPPNLLSAYETANNPGGICCLSSRHIAFPGMTTGQVQLVEIATGSVSIIPAHSSALRAMQFSPDGDLLATSSEMGTLIRVFATSNCARLVELRRGIDPATIFSLAFSPSGTQLACTSDKSTLHIFDVPHPNKKTTLPSSSPSAGRQSSVSPTSPDFPHEDRLIAASSTSDATITPSSTNDGRGKWGILSKIPLMPRMFSDVYSFASAPFEGGPEPQVGGLPMSGSATLGTARPPKGIIGWLSEDTLVVVGGGQDARWEKFAITREATQQEPQQQNGFNGPTPAPSGGQQNETRRVCVRAGWKRYLGSP
ncbi:SVP1-like protein 2 [Naviculisporaceae sp. PSN 640]